MFVTLNITVYLFIPKAEGTATPSFVRNQLEHRAGKVEKGESVEMTLEDIKGAASTIFAGRSIVFFGNDLTGLTKFTLLSWPKHSQQFSPLLYISTDADTTDMVDRHCIYPKHAFTPRNSEEGAG